MQDPQNERRPLTAEQVNALDEAQELSATYLQASKFVTYASIAGIVGTVLFLASSLISPDSELRKEGVNGNTGKTISSILAFTLGLAALGSHLNQLAAVELVKAVKAAGFSSMQEAQEYKANGTAQDGTRAQPKAPVAPGASHFNTVSPAAEDTGLHHRPGQATK
jgi:hypothetical protein